MEKFNVYSTLTKTSKLQRKLVGEGLEAGEAVVTARLVGNKAYEVLVVDKMDMTVLHIREGKIIFPKGVVQ